jgi:hypothetical protein
MVEAGDTTMSRSTNPDPPDSAEHWLWEQWHEAYLAQPPDALLYDAESHLRGLVRRFTALGYRLADPTVARDLRHLILELEAEADRLEELADRTHARLMVRREW